jgi:hypothetical protein
VLVVLAMLRALVAARCAGHQTRLQLRPYELRVGVLLTGEHAAGRDTHVGAVVVEANATAQHVDRLLAEARIGACATALCAVEAGLDAADQRFIVQ